MAKHDYTEPNLTVKVAIATYVDEDFTEVYANIANNTSRVSALETGTVKNTGNETVAGVKTFSSSPVIPTPVSDLQAATKKYVDDSILAGTEVFWPIDTPPAGWLEEDGTAISRTTYAVLFGIIGTAYGIGDGSTTFNLPSPQGRVIRVWDHAAGVDPDAADRTDPDGSAGVVGDIVGSNQDDQANSLDVVDRNVANGTQGEFTIPDDGSYSNHIALTEGNNLDSMRFKKKGVESRTINTNRMMIIKY